MDNREFDEIIRRGLEDMTSQSPDAGWESFKEKWDAADTPPPEDVNVDDTDSLFDSKIKADMQGLRMPFNSAHWVQLKAKLIQQAIFRKQLYTAKIVELTVLALLVMTILNIWPIQNDIYQIPVYDSPMVASIPVEKEVAEKYEAQEIERKQTRDKNLSKLLGTSTPTTSKPIALKNKVASKNYPYSKIEDTNNRNFEQAGKKHKTEVKSNSDNTILNDFPFVPKQTLSNSAIPNNLNETSNNQPIASVLNHPTSINSIQSSITSPARPIGYPDISFKEAALEEEATYLSLAIGPKVNLVNSPFDPVYELDPHNIVNTNYSVSAKLEKQIGPVELFTGLGYSKTSYRPEIVKEHYAQVTQNYNETSLKNIEFKTVNIPIGVKYDIVSKPNLKVYAVGGVDVNLIGKANYEVTDGPVGRAAPALKPSQDGRLNVNENAKLSRKIFNPGILDGGGLKENLYASASIGIGLVKNISPEVGIFVEPRYSHYISTQGIGPNADKVHSLSFNTGVRYRLN